MSPIEKIKWSDITKALNPEQRKIVLANIKTTELEDELSRRDDAANRKVDQIYEVINRFTEAESTLVNMQSFIRELKGVLCNGQN